MTLQDLIKIMQNRLITLNEAKKSATAAGDLEQIVKIDGDILTTTVVIQQLINSNTNQ